MTETSGIKDCIDKEETSYFKKLITNIIYRLSQLRANHYGYQVFIEGRKLKIDNFECIKKLIDEINIRVPLSVTHLLTLKDEGGMPKQVSIYYLLYTKTKE